MKKGYIAHETTICRNPHNSSNWDSPITRQLRYKHTCYCRSVTPTKKMFSPHIFVRTKHAFVLVYSESVKFFPYPVQFCAVNYDILLFHERYVLLALLHTRQMKFFISAHVQVNKTGVPRLGPQTFISRPGLVFLPGQYFVNIYNHFSKWKFLAED